MSESPIQQAQRKAAENRAKGVRPKKATEVLSQKKDASHMNTYLDNTVIRGLKQRALDEKTTVSKLIEEAATSAWSLAEPIRWPKKEGDEYPDIEL